MVREKHVAAGVTSNKLFAWIEVVLNTGMMHSVDSTTVSDQSFRLSEQCFQHFVHFLKNEDRMEDSRRSVGDSGTSPSSPVKAESKNACPAVNNSIYMKDKRVILFFYPYPISLASASRWHEPSVLSAPSGQVKDIVVCRVCVEQHWCERSHFPGRVSTLIHLDQLPAALGFNIPDTAAHFTPRPWLPAYISHFGVTLHRLHWLWVGLTPGISFYIYKRMSAEFSLLSSCLLIHCIQANCFY